MNELNTFLAHLGNITSESWYLNVRFHSRSYELPKSPSQDIKLVDEAAKNFGEYLRACRLAVGFDLSTFASETGLPEAEILALEHGLISSEIIEISSLHALEKALNEDISIFALLLERQDITSSKVTGVARWLYSSWRQIKAFFGVGQTVLVLSLLTTGFIILLSAHDWITLFGLKISLVALLPLVTFWWAVRQRHLLIRKIDPDKLPRLASITMVLLGLLIINTIDFTRQDSSIEKIYKTPYAIELAPRQESSILIAASNTSSVDRSVIDFSPTQAHYNVRNRDWKRVTNFSFSKLGQYPELTWNWSPLNEAKPYYAVRIQPGALGRTYTWVTVSSRNLSTERAVAYDLDIVREFARRWSMNRIMKVNYIDVERIPEEKPVGSLAQAFPIDPEAKAYMLDGQSLLKVDTWSPDSGRIAINLVEDRSHLRVGTQVDEVLWIEIFEPSLDNRVQAVEVSGGVSLWFGTRGGVSHYTPSGNPEWESFTTADGLAANDVRVIAAGVDGSLWFGTYGSGVSHYTPTGSPEWESFTTVGGLIGNHSTNNLILVSGDDIIPFHSMTDQNVTFWQERSYHSYVPLGRVGLALTADRSVETPKEIATVIEAFRKANWSINLESGVVGADSQLADDLRQAQCNTLQDGGLAVAIRTSNPDVFKQAVLEQASGSVWAALHSNHFTLGPLSADDILGRPQKNDQTTFITVNPTDFEKGKSHSIQRLASYSLSYVPESDVLRSQIAQLILNSYEDGIISGLKVNKIDSPLKWGIGNNAISHKIDLAIIRPDISGPGHKSSWVGLYRHSPTAAILNDNQYLVDSKPSIDVHSTGDLLVQEPTTTHPIDTKVADLPTQTYLFDPYRKSLTKLLGISFKFLSLILVALIVQVAKREGKIKLALAKLKMTDM